jgi:hypothetical protein
VSGRPAETADVSLVVDFLNTIDIDEGTDELADFTSWRQWAEHRGLRPDPLEESRHARDALRALLGDPRLEPAQTRAPIQVDLSASGPAFAAENAVGAVLAAAAKLAVLGDWERVKICPAANCLWAFYDQSRNRSRHWCSMRTCGNREKARAWRERDSGHKTPLTR